MRKHIQEKLNTDIQLGDCLEIFSQYPNDTFDLIFTSPPYADRRVNTDGGIKLDQYVEWFLPRSKELERFLKTDGTFI